MKELEANRLERVTWPSGAAVREGGIGAVPVRLEQARPYRLTVVAGDDASKLAVIVVNRETKTVALQQAVDGRVLQANFAAPFTGSYEVAVRIGTCTVQRCGYRVMLHATPSTGMRQMRYAPAMHAPPSSSPTPSSRPWTIRAGSVAAKSLSSPAPSSPRVRSRARVRITSPVVVPATGASAACTTGRSGGPVNHAAAPSPARSPAAPRPARQLFRNLPMARPRDGAAVTTHRS